MLLIAVALPALLTGCFPYRYTKRPGLSGQTVAMSDSTPVANATVRAFFKRPYKDLAPVEIATRPDGSFDLPAKTFWGVYFIPQHMGQPGVCTIEVTSEGYETETREFHWWLTGPLLGKLGAIKLLRSAGMPSPVVASEKGCVSDGPLHLQPGSFSAIRLGMNRAQVEAILGDPDYSPTAGVDYFSTPGRCEVNAGQTAPCGYVIEYRDSSKGEAVDTGRVVSCRWGGIGE